LVILGDSFNHLHSWGEKHGVSEAAQVEPPIFNGQTGKTTICGMFLLFFLQENLSDCNYMGCSWLFYGL
jgi:hypothetical protein